MKFFLLPVALCILLLHSVSYSQPAESLSKEQVHSLELYCKVWGFLKYYHPQVASGFYNWDSVFIRHYFQAKEATTDKERAIVLTALYLEAGQSERAVEYATDVLPDTAFIPLTSFRWLDDLSPIDSQLALSLKELLKSRPVKQSAYVRWDSARDNINFTADSQWFTTAGAFPSEPIRMLGFSRYWNIVEYFYPYKQELRWDTILPYYLPKVSNATETTIPFVFLSLAARLNDPLGFYDSRKLYDLYGTVSDQLLLRRVDGDLVISGINPLYASNEDSLLEILHLKRGDIVVAVGSNAIDDISRYSAEYFCRSNNSIFYNVFSRFLQRFKHSTTLTVDRNGQRITTTLHYLPPSPTVEYLRYRAKDPWKILTGNIGYVNLEKLRAADVTAAMKELLQTSALIIDDRLYPNDTTDLFNFLTGPVQADRGAVPSLKRPGYSFSEYDTTKWTKFGKEKKYSGKIVLLVDYRTQYSGEFIGMVYQAIEGVKTIGSQTEGAVSNSALICLPGFSVAGIATVGSWYPDGKPVHGVGLKIDYVVHPTIAGIREGRDEILERAIEYIKTGK